jgi:cyanate permease
MAGLHRRARSRPRAEGAVVYRPPTMTTAPTAASTALSTPAPAPPPPARAAPTPPARPVRWAVLLGVWLAYFSFGLIGVGLAPLVGPVTRDLGLSHAAMGTVLGVWQAVYIAAAVPCGTLLDRLGARHALFLGALIVALSGLLRGLAVDFWTLCLAVGLFGLGGPLISAGAPKVISHWFRGSERGLAMGIYITGPSLGAILGLSLTHSLLMPLFAADWRRVLMVWSAVALGGALAWFALASLPAARAHAPAPVSGPRQSQRAAIGQLLRLAPVRVLLAMSVCIFAYNHGLNSWLPELLRVDGMTPSEAGYWATIPTLVGIAGSLLIPRLATPRRRVPILAGLAVAAGLSTLLLHAEPGPLLAAGLVAQGIARSSLMTVAMLSLVETRGVGERNAGIAGGLFFSAAEIGGAGGPILLGSLYDATGGFAAGLWLLTGMALAILAGALRLGALSAAPQRHEDR